MLSVSLRYLNSFILRPSNSLAASGVVKPPDESPEELDDPCEEFAEISQHDQEEGNADDRVDDRCDSARSGLWSYVPVTWK